MDWSFESKNTIMNNIKVITDQEIEKVVYEMGGETADTRLTIIQGIYTLMRAIKADIEGGADQ